MNIEKTASNIQITINKYLDRYLHDLLVRYENDMGIIPFLETALEFYESCVGHTEYDQGFLTPERYREENLNTLTEEDLLNRKSTLVNDILCYLDDVNFALPTALMKDDFHWWLQEGASIPNLILDRAYIKQIDRRLNELHRGYAFDEEAGLSLFKDIFHFVPDERLLHEFLDSFAEQLDQQETQIVISFYGLNRDKKSLNEITQEMGITKEEAEDTLQKALKRLSGPYYHQQLTGSDKEMIPVTKENFLKVFNNGQCCYVQGEPASGKTLWVKAYLRALKGEEETKFLIYSGKSIELQTYVEPSRLLGGKIYDSLVEETFLDKLEECIRSKTPALCFIEEASDFFCNPKLKDRFLSLLQSDHPVLLIHMTSQRPYPYDDQLRMCIIKMRRPIENEGCYLLQGEEEILYGRI